MSKYMSCFPLLSQGQDPGEKIPDLFLVARCLEGALLSAICMAGGCWKGWAG